MDCELLPEENFFKCKLCGWKTTNKDVHRNCPIKLGIIPKNILHELQTPSFLNRVKNFGKAAVEHIKHGSPKSSQEQINDRLEICKGCPLFRVLREEPIQGMCTHTQCGCNITASQQFMNKLAWKDQQCPIGNWVNVDQKYI